MRSRLIGSGIVLAAACLALPACGRPAGRSSSNVRLLDDLVTANRILAHERIVDGYGHVSARSADAPDRFFLARAMAPGIVTIADLVEYDLAGEPIGKPPGDSYAERFIHAEIYRSRPDVRAVVHGHLPSVIPFADSDVAMRPMYHMSGFLAGGVPVFDIRDVEGVRGMLVTDARLGQALARTLGSAPVLLMRGHGAVIVGGSLSAAVSRSVYLDLNARMQAQAIALGGTVKYMESEDDPEARRDAGTYDRNWEFWKQQALGK